MKKNKHKAIFLFNRTRIMLQPWLDAGYECWTFDGQLPEGVHEVEPGLMAVGMWFRPDVTPLDAEKIARMVGGNVKFIASFAECTFLTTAGARWLYHPDDKHLPTCDRRPHPLYPNRKRDRSDAVRLARLVSLVAANCRLMDGPFSRIPWMLENPARSFLTSLWRPYNHTFNPCDYGGYLPVDHKHSVYPDKYPARDAYTKLTAIWCNDDFVMPEKKSVFAAGRDFNAVVKMGGKSKDTKNVRSATPEGFARAVFEANHHG